MTDYIISNIELPNGNICFLKDSVLGLYIDEDGYICQRIGSDENVSE